MGEEAAALISGVMGSWLFTPSSIFIILNIVIGTIFIRYRFGAPIVHAAITVASVTADPIRQIHHLPKLLRSSKTLLHPITSFNYQTDYTLSTHPQREVEIPCPNPEKPQLAGSAPSLLQRLHSNRSSESIDGDDDQKEAEMEGEEIRRQLREDEEDAEEGRRQLREDQEEDAKADDFINSFKKELRLQRVNSFLNYEQMLQRN